MFLKQHRTLFSALMATVVLTGLLTGCSTEQNYAKVDDSGMVHYTTDDSTDPLNYTTYVNKEITLVMNILSTHISTGENIRQNKAIASDEIRAVTSDLDMVQEAITSVETLNPPTDYEDDRDAILQKLVNAQSSLQAYGEALADETADLRGFIGLMESDYFALSGAFNLPWE